MQAMTFMLPPQTRQVSMSIANTRFKRCAQLIAAWLANWVFSTAVHNPQGEVVPLNLFRAASPHFSLGSREQAQDSFPQAPLWSEKRSNSYGLSEEQACVHEDQPEP
jgi:hypothetical protein